MQAVDENKKNIQTVIDGIEDDENPKDNEDPSKEQDPKSQEDPDADSKSKDEETPTKESGHAFAAMRKRISELTKENEDLAKKLESSAAQPSTQGKDADTKQQVDENNSEISELRKEIAELKSEREREKEDQKVSQKAYELQKVRDEFNLSNEQLKKFADDADKRGYDILTSPMSVRDIYVSINHDALVRDVEERTKKQLLEQQDGLAPSTGPKSPQRTQKGKPISEILDKIEKATK